MIEAPRSGRDRAPARTSKPVETEDALERAPPSSRKRRDQREAKENSLFPRCWTGLCTPSRPQMPCSPPRRGPGTGSADAARVPRGAATGPAPCRPAERPAAWRATAGKSHDLNGLSEALTPVAAADPGAARPRISRQPGQLESAKAERGPGAVVSSRTSQPHGERSRENQINAICCRGLCTPSRARSSGRSVLGASRLGLASSALPAQRDRPIAGSPTNRDSGLQTRETLTF
jgi:hypothetical protein